MNVNNKISSAFSKIIFATLIMTIITGAVAADQDGTLSDNTKSGTFYKSPGTSDVMVQSFNISDSGSSDSSGIDVDHFNMSNTGSASDSDVSNISIYKGSDLTYDGSANEDLVDYNDSTSFFDSQITIGRSDDTAVDTVSDGNTQTYFVVVDIASGATDDNEIITEVNATTTRGSDSTFDDTAPDTSPTASSAGTTKIDNSPPTFDSAITGNTKGGDNSAKNKVTLSFSDTGAGLNSSTFAASDFSLGDKSITGLSFDSGEVELTLGSSLATNATPEVTLEDSVEDKVGNSLSGVNQDPSDGLQPELLTAEIDNVQSGDSSTFVEMTFSEPVDTSTSTQAIVNGTTTVLGEQDGDNSDSTLSLDLGRLLQTGTSPNVTSVSSITDTGDSNSARIPGDGKVEVNTFRKQLNEGWNFVSFPVADDTTYQLSEVMNMNKVEIVWKYQDGQWKSSNTQFNKVEGGVGYLVNATEEFTIAPNVNNIRKDVDGQTLPTQSIGISNGWNLVGQFQEYDQTADTTGAFGALHQEDLGAVEEQDSSGNLGLTRIAQMDSKQSSGTMNTGSAYWMWAKDSTSYTWN